MTINPATDPPLSSENFLADRGKIASFLSHTDQWCQRLGDRCNPIVVKETRQALKSRQFVITFSVLLVAALGWTVIGSLSMMPQIYTNPSAPRMLIGYYVVLAIPMLLVVPLAAYRSLEAEIDDGTLELLSITVLTARQIVQGKLFSAMLQMLLYFVALLPCVAYAYTLRGVDLPTILLVVLMLALAGIFLTIVGLFFAPLARSRSGRIVTLLVVIAALMSAEWLMGFVVIGVIQFGNPLSAGETFFAVTAGLALVLVLSDLLLACTTAQLTPPSENRSTRIRWSLLLVTGTCIGLVTFALLSFPNEQMGLMFGLVISIGLLAIMTFASSLMCSESPVITPRVRREFPDSFLARIGFTWLTPGPLTGLAFSVVLITLICAAMVMICGYAVTNGIGGVRFSRAFPRTVIAYGVYLCLGLCLTYWLMRLLRLRNQPRVETGASALIAIAAMSCLIPYSISLHLNDYRQVGYSGFQFTNWAWTIAEVGLNNYAWQLVMIVSVVTVVMFLVTLLTDPTVVFPRRMAMPKRVLEELKRQQDSAAV